jgi:hypothetical protein
MAAARISLIVVISLAHLVDARADEPKASGARKPNIVILLADDKDCLTGGFVEKCVKLLRIPTVSGSFEVPQTSVN